MKSKTNEELEGHVEWLLRNSHMYDRGPHGRTITAVMKAVKTLVRRANSQLRLVRKAS
jgi:hypothetical protein